MKKHIAIIFIVSFMSFSCSSSPALIKIGKRQQLYKEGRICDECAADNFANYQPCWKVTPEQVAAGEKACSVCVAWGKCCKTKEEECCCFDNKEACYKKCKIRIPIKTTNSGPR